MSLLVVNQILSVVYPKDACGYITYVDLLAIDLKSVGTLAGSRSTAYLSKELWRNSSYLKKRKPQEEDHHEYVNPTKRAQPCSVGWQNNILSFVFGKLRRYEKREKRIEVDNITSIIANVSLTRTRIRKQSPWQSCLKQLSGQMKESNWG